MISDKLTISFWVASFDQLPYCQPSWMVAITINHKNGCHGSAIKDKKVPYDPKLDLTYVKLLVIHTRLDIIHAKLERKVKLNIRQFRFNPCQARFKS